MNRTRLVLAAITATAISPAWAHSGSLEDQMACTPDVYRLCSSEVPDEDKIVACLEHNKPNLSPACGKVFSRSNDPTKTNSDDSE